MTHVIIKIDNVIMGDIGLIHLEKIIEILRTEMMKTANEKGFSSFETLEISQKLDEYICVYQEMKKILTN